MVAGIIGDCGGSYWWTHSCLDVSIPAVASVTWISVPCPGALRREKVPFSPATRSRIWPVLVRADVRLGIAGAVLQVHRGRTIGGTGVYRRTARLQVVVPRFAPRRADEARVAAEVPRAQRGDVGAGVGRLAVGQDRLVLRQAEEIVVGHQRAAAVNVDGALRPAPAEDDVAHRHLHRHGIVVLHVHQVVVPHIVVCQL